MTASSPETMMKAKSGRILVVKGDRSYRREVIMGRTLGAGPSVGHPLLCETATLRTVPVANSSEWTQTWSSCVAHSTKAALIVPGGIPSIQSLPVWGIHWISLMKSTRQGNGSSSWTVRGERGGPGTTVKRKKNKKNSKQICLC